jgi:hypothetical protein
VRVRRHTARVVGPFAPQRRRGRLFAELRAVATTLRRESLADTVRSIYRCRVQQKHRGESQCVEGESHEGEVRVYRSPEGLQQIPTWPETAGG